MDSLGLYLRAQAPIYADMHEAYEIIAATKEVPLFIFGDHASRYIPAEYDNLGLTDKDLNRHIAWDIGTAEVVRGLCEEFGCGGQLATTSRLLIDLNRGLSLKSLIPEISDGTIIPGNTNISETEWQNRVDRFHTPYHEAIGTALDNMGFGMAISIHSFTPQLAGKELRELEIGLLFKVDNDSAEKFKVSLNNILPDWRVAYNEPYSAFDLNHTIDVNVSARSLPHLSIEVNQALIDTDEKARSVASILARALNPLVDKLKKSK